MWRARILLTALLVGLAAPVAAQQFFPFGTVQIGKAVRGGTAGSVLFVGAGSVLAQDPANLFWDVVTKRLSIGLGAAATRGTVEIKQVVDSSSGGISIANAVFTNTLRIWEDANAIGRIDGGSLGNVNIAINGAGVGYVGIGTVLPERTLHVKGDAILIERASNSPGVIYRNTLDGDFPTQEWITATHVDAATDIDNLSFVYRASTVATTLPIFHASKVGNIGIGSTESFPFPSTGTMGLLFEDGTALATMGSNTAGFYADDVAGTVQQFAINEAGTVSRLTGIIDSNGQVPLATGVTGTLPYGNGGTGATSFTSGRVVFAGASALTDDADLTFATDTLTGTKIVGSTYVSAGTSESTGVLNLPAAESNTPAVRFHHDSTTADAGISTYTDANGSYMWFGANSYVNAAGNPTRFDTSAASAAIQYEPGSIAFYTGGTGAGPTQKWAIYSDGNFEGIEQTAPSAAAANKGRIYFQDNGAGKTQLCVLFSSGAAQCFATQP